MKWLCGILRVALALLLMVLALPYYFALSAGSLYAVLHDCQWLGGGGAGSAAGGGR